MYQCLMVKYGELGLKGKNKSQFINRLVKNIKHTVDPCRPREIISTWGRILVPVDHDITEIIDRLQRVLSLIHICLVHIFSRYFVVILFLLKLVLKIFLGLLSLATADNN